MNLFARLASRYEIDTDLVLPKVCYLVLTGAFGALLPFLPVFYDAIGIPIEQIGLLGAIRPFITFLSAPLWALVADRFKLQKSLLLATLVASASLRFSILFIVSFGALAIILPINEFIGAPVTPLLDASVIHILGPERKQFYGKQRLWGAAGYGLVALVAGALVKTTGNIYLYFYIHIGIMAIAAVVVSRLDIVAPTPTSSFWKSLGLVVASWQMFFFFLTTFAIGAAAGTIANFALLHVSALGGDKTLLGSMLAVSCSSEVLFFWFSSSLLSKLGPAAMMYISLAALVVRLAWYSLLTAPLWVLPAEFLQGCTFAMMWSGAIQYAHSVAPPGLGSTVQGLLVGIYSGLGQGVGTIVGGFINKQFGARALFATMSIACTIALIVMVISNSYFYFKGLHFDQVDSHQQVPQSTAIEMQDESDEVSQKKAVT